MNLEDGEKRRRGPLQRGGDFGAVDEWPAGRGLRRRGGRPSQATGAAHFGFRSGARPVPLRRPPARPPAPGCGGPSRASCGAAAPHLGPSPGTRTVQTSGRGLRLPSHAHGSFQALLRRALPWTSGPAALASAPAGALALKDQAEARPCRLLVVPGFGGTAGPGPE